MQQEFINAIKTNNYNKNSKSLMELFRVINELDESFSYRDFIRRDLLTPNCAFGKFFKQNGGIQKQICRVYYYNEVHTQVEKRDTFRKCLICDIKINDKIYCCYIESNHDQGCYSCGMGRDIDHFMYISYNLKTLVIHCLPLNAMCFQ